MSKKTLLISFILSTFLLFTTAGQCLADASTEAVRSNHECKWLPVDQNSFPEILSMIEERVKDNYNKISTWQGKVRKVSDDVYETKSKKKLFEQILIDRPLPKKVKDHRELTREFALDSRWGLVYDNYYSDGQNYSIDVETGKKLQLKEPGQIDVSGKFILTPDYLLECIESKNRKGVIVRRDVIKQARPEKKHERISHMPPCFDPRESMRIWGDIAGKSFDPLGGSFARYLAFFDKKGGKSIDGYPTITVEECNVGDYKKYRIVLIVLSKDSTGATVHLFSNLVCSNKAGFNVVSYITTDSNDRGLENKSWEYGLFNGVYIPVQNKELRFDYHTGNLNEQSTVTFMDQKVNEPIPPGVFTYKNLGLKNGDQYIDNILNKIYAYQDGNLIEAENINK